jgi:hypothetical protein
MQPHLRPLDTGEILDGAFHLYRRHPAAYALAGLLPMLPMLAVWAWLGVGAGKGMEYGEDQVTQLFMLALYGGWPSATLARVIAVRMTDDALMGRPVRPGWGAALRRMPAALWASGLTSVVIFLPALGTTGVMSVVLRSGEMPPIMFYVFYVLGWIGAVLLAARYTAMLPAVVLERVSGDTARRRSLALSRGRWRKVTAVWTTTFLFSWLPWLAVAGVMSAAGSSLEGLGMIACFGLSQAAAALVFPLAAAARTLLFADLRIRAEGLDVRVLTEQLAGA